MTKKIQTIGEAMYESFKSTRTGKSIVPDSVVKAKREKIMREMMEGNEEYEASLRFRQNSYDILFNTITNQYNYYVDFRTDKKGVYCPHPHYATEESEEDLMKDNCTYFIGKPIQEVLGYIEKKNTAFMRDTYKENNHECYLYKFLANESARSLDILGVYNKDVVFVSSTAGAVDYYILFNSRDDDLNQFSNKLSKLFYRDDDERTAERLAWISSKLPDDSGCVFI